MPTSNSIRRSDAAHIYAAVIQNFRRAYKDTYGVKPDELTDEEVLLCWEEGWMADDSTSEDLESLQAMNRRITNKQS